METKIDPSGDIVLILKSADAQVFSWPEHLKQQGGKEAPKSKNGKKGKNGRKLPRDLYNVELAAEPGVQPS